MAGGADGLHDPAYQAEVAGKVDGQVLVIDGADHSLEIRDNVAASLQALRQVVEAVQSFIAA